MWYGSFTTKKPQRWPDMNILHGILTKQKKEFALSGTKEERGTWFICTLVAIIVPFACSKSFNLLRCLNTMFGFTIISQKRYHRFMASPKIPWGRLWPALWKMIPKLLTRDRLIIAIDDYINSKTGKKIIEYNGQVEDRGRVQGAQTGHWQYRCPGQTSRCG